jgi:hypothetical protein
MSRFVLSTIVGLALMVSSLAQVKPGSPSEAAVNFYTGLRDKKYVAGFRHSVYRGAVEGLSEAELLDLEPDFSQTFTSIPAKIEVKNERITGNNAIVMLKFDGMAEPQPVALILVGKEWLVGDEETLRVVKAQGRTFFFNARILVNEGEVTELLTRIIGAEFVYSQRFEGKHASLAELVRLDGVPKELEDHEANGYTFILTLAPDEKSFNVTATPVLYGKTGRLSFYADADGIRSQDNKGQPVSASAPRHQAN